MPKILDPEQQLKARLAACARERDAWRTWWLEAYLATKLLGAEARRAEKAGDAALEIIRRSWPELDAICERELARRRDRLT